MKMENPAWRFNGNERKYLEEVLSTGFRAGADGAFTNETGAIFCKSIQRQNMGLALIQELRHYTQSF